MQPSLEAPARLNVSLALPSSPLCSSRWWAAWPRGLALHQSTAAQFRYEVRPGNWMLRLWGRPSRTRNTPMDRYDSDANLLLELTRKGGCDSDSGA
jgi:hypothetical protein